MHGSLATHREDSRAGVALSRAPGFAVLLAAMLPACTPAPVSVQVNPPGSSTTSAARAPASTAPGTSSSPPAPPGPYEVRVLDLTPVRASR
jgi:hypothetical protein